MPDNAEHGFLDVGTGHQIYYETSGNPNGIPILYLHGGPGGGCSGKEHQYFNPETYFIILLDQRGAGKSIPFAETSHNSPEYLIEDLERLRQHLDIESWILCAASWGSCLALLYTIQHPECVRRLLLRGLFFGDLKSAQYIIEEWGAAQIQPKYFEQYATAPFVPKDARSNLTRMYYEVFEFGTEETQIEAAVRFHIWDHSIAYAYIDERGIERLRRKPRDSLAISRLFFHFTVNAFAVNDYKGRILGGTNILSDVPITLIHGECDWICPVENAYLFKQAYPNAEIQIIPGGGHTIGDPTIRNALIKVLNQWSEKL